jgi:hypothetical protein
MTDFNLTDFQYLLYVVLMNYLTIFSGVLYLLAFILIGLVALRVGRVFAVKTYWPLMFLGPIGALVYSVYTIVHGSGSSGSQQAYMMEQRLAAYGAFLVCGILCWWGMRKFWKALESLMKEGREIKYLKDGKEK